MKFFDTLFAEKVKHIVNIPQPQERRGVKSNDSFAFNVFHECVGNDWMRDFFGVPNVWLSRK